MKFSYKKIFQRTVIGLGSLSMVVLIVLSVIYIFSSQHMNHSYQISPHPVSVVPDSDRIAYGKHLSQIRGCTHCHGEDLSGGLFINAPLVMELYASNLTPGSGGVGARYTPADWERAIRHGIGLDGKPLLFMPSLEFFHLSDEDLAALIAYLRTLPPVNKTLPVSTVGPLGRFLYLMGKIPLIHAELVDHSAAHPVAPSPAITVEYGRYLALGCMGCHGPRLTGGKIPGAPPEWPPAADLTPSGNLKNWDENDFIEAIRTGIKPNGQKFLPQMPYQTLNAMTDKELKAVWLFLQSLPSKTEIAQEEMFSPQKAGN